MLLRAHEHKQMPWKNGGGITSEIDRAPKNEHEDFDWRISMAQVKPPGGPFSIFPGIDRTLCIISQHELCLALDDNTTGRIHLNQNSLPYSFPGELSIHCQVADETLTDFNVMTRRTKFRHNVEHVKLKLQHEKQLDKLDQKDEIIFIVVGHGQLKTNDGIEIAKGDALRIDNYNSNIRVFAEADNTQFYIVRINPILSKEIIE